MAAVCMASAEAAAGELLADARTWTAPLIGDGAPGAGRAARRTDAQREEEKRLFAEAEAAGRAAGLAAAQKEIAARTAALEERARACEAMMEALSRPLAQLDDQVHEQIATLAVRIARAVVRRELRMDPAQVIGIVRATVALLPASTQGLRVVLNPEDAALVRERLPAAGPEAAWSIVEDPTLGRGDCRVHTDFARLDARVETRLNEALTALVGEERTWPRDGEAT